MGTSLFRIRSVFRSALAFSLAFAVSGVPQAIAADWSKQSFAPSGQSGAQQQNSNNNNMASMLSKAASVISMAAGGLYMAKGAEQLKCCSSGCNPQNGSKATEEQRRQQEENRNRGSTITRPPGQSTQLSPSRCPNRAPELPAIFRVFSFFQPPQADAALGSCLDAMIALATGGLMLLQGLMGLQAANQSGNLANQSAGNMDGMGTLGNGTSPTPTGPGTTSLGTGGSGMSPIKMDPALLRKGTANDIMNQFESKFGLNRDKFANDVLSGKDPREIFGSAPHNALSNADMNKATAQAKGMSDSEKAKALAGTALSDAQKELALKLGTGQGDPAYAMNLSGGERGLAGFKGTAKKEEELETLEKPPVADVPLGEVSPDVKAALLAKEKADRMAGLTDLTIFQVVHQKYREKSKAIFGYDPDGALPKGVTGAGGI